MSGRRSAAQAYAEKKRLAREKAEKIRRERMANKAAAEAAAQQRLAKQRQIRARMGLHSSDQDNIFSAPQPQQQQQQQQYQQQQQPQQQQQQQRRHHIPYQQQSYPDHGHQQQQQQQPQQYHQQQPHHHHDDSALQQRVSELEKQVRDLADRNRWLNEFVDKTTRDMEDMQARLMQLERAKASPVKAGRRSGKSQKQSPAVRSSGGRQRANRYDDNNDEEGGEYRDDFESEQYATRGGGRSGASARSGGNNNNNNSSNYDDEDDDDDDYGDRDRYHAPSQGSYASQHRQQRQQEQAQQQQQQQQQQPSSAPVNVDDIPIGGGGNDIYAKALDDQAVGQSSWQPPSEQPENVKLYPCKHCKRKFRKEALSKHVKSGICTKKRRKFEVERIDAEDKQNFDAYSAKQSAKKAAKLKAKQAVPKWKRDRDALREAMKANRMIAKAQKEGIDIATLDLPKSQVVDDRVPCPHCGRKFNQTAADRHIPKCKTTKHKPTFLRRNKNRR